MPEPLIFINPAIIERIENGSFVPARLSSTSHPNAERRNVLSPLNVAKRCIRYEPNVFEHRKPAILQMARALNQPAQKIVLVGGPQGCGKTSLVRGLIELLGSRNEQLLWFDVNRHTDFEEIIQFLIQYITYIGITLGTNQTGSNPPPSRPEATPEDPLQRLENLLGQMAEMPLLLVLDNVEYIVDPELRFNSYPFKEMLNFLLAFPNVKMVLIGERLPYADMSPNQEGVEDIRLEGLREDDAVTFIQHRKKGSLPNSTVDMALLENAAAPDAENAALPILYQRTHGQPWLLKIAYYLNHQAELDYVALNRMLESTQASADHLPVMALTRFLYQRLPDQHRRLFHILTFLRHPVDTRTLLALLGVCYPILGPSSIDRNSVQDMLEHSLLKTVMKINYPPQEVLAHIRERRRQGLSSTGQAYGQGEKKFKPWYELYHDVKQALAASLPAEERERIHSALQNFYLREKGLEPEQRILKIKNRALLSEAKYHGNAARDRRMPANPAGTIRLDVADNATIASRSYLSGSAQPGGSQQPLTLADYQKVRLPDSENPNDEAGTDLPEEMAPDFQSFLAGSAGKLSWKEQLAELELTEEEKQLLARQQTLGEMLQSEHGAPQTIASPQPEPALPPATTAPAPNPAPVPTLDVLSASQLAQANDEQEKEIQKRLAAAVAAQEKRMIAKELVALARYRASHGRYDGATPCLEKALSLKAEASRDIVAEIYRLTGSISKETYHHNDALSSLNKAAEEIRRLMYEDDTVSAVWLARLGKVYQDLGEIHAYRKQHEEAIEAFTQALRWHQSAEDKTRLAETHFLLAGVYDDANQPANAIEHYQKAATLDEANGNHLSAAAAWANLGGLAQENGDWQQAIACFQQSLDHDRQASNLNGQWSTLEAISTLFAEQEKWGQAELAARQGLAMAIKQGDALWQATFYVKLGQVQEAQQQWANALKHFQLAQSCGEKVLSSQSLKWLGESVKALQRKV